jgi:radical SAM protein with 4Fe4S-binding SPASM domain
MRENVEELAEVFDSIVTAGAATWEVFFLVNVGRGTTAEAVTAAEHEQVCHFLYDAAGHGLAVRAVEAPFLRRVAAERAAGGPRPRGSLYQALAGRLRDLRGQGTGQPGIRSASTRDGKGIIFVAHDGAVYPAGFLPLLLGNVRTQSLIEIYRDHPLLRSIRAARFTGRCGRCEHADLCGGSRSRAYASGGDPLGEDPACGYLPA